MLKAVLFSNIDLKINYTPINVDFPETSKPIEIIKMKLIELSKTDPNSTFLIRCHFVGRRIVEHIQEKARVLNNRRINIYLGLYHKNKITIVFGWHKLKKLSLDEKKIVENSWSDKFLEEKRHLITKSGGFLFYEHLLYKITLK
jgi:hypothetical protein